MKSILISIKPEYAAKILNGDKTIEIRKTAPKDWLDYLSGKTKKKPDPIDIYIYCTKGKNYEFLTKATAETFVVGGLFCAQSPRNGKIVAKFTLNKVEEVERYTNDNFGVYDRLWEEYGTADLEEKELLELSCLEKNEIGQYLKWHGFEYAHGYAWYISDLVIFDEPKKLWEFGLMRAPQSWQYVVYPYGFKVGEKVKLSPQCAEYIGKEDKVYKVLGEPKRIGGSHCTPICYNGINQYFATEYLTYAEVEGLKNLNK